jgi:hypothetical protein
MGAAQYSLPSPLMVCNRDARTLAAANLHPTLVAGTLQPDFSTDAANSALISKRNLRATTQYQFQRARQTESKKTKATFWLSKEEASCHGENCLDDNS